MGWKMVLSWDADADHVDLKVDSEHDAQPLKPQPVRSGPLWLTLPAPAPQGPSILDDDEDELS
jgi:hypothetical protein